MDHPREVWEPICSLHSLVPSALFNSRKKRHKGKTGQGRDAMILGNSWGWGDGGDNCYTVAFEEETPRGTSASTC